MRHENHNAASPDRASLHPNSPEKIAKKHDFMLDDGRFLMKNGFRCTVCALARMVLECVN
jgi:hypothetical protein